MSILWSETALSVLFLGVLRGIRVQSGEGKDGKGRAGIWQTLKDDPTQHACLANWSRGTREEAYGSE